MKQNDINQYSKQKFKQSITSNIDSYILSDIKKQQMWHNINHMKQKRSRKIRNYIGAAAACIIVLAVCGAAVNTVSGGRVVAAIREAGGNQVIEAVQRLWGIEPEGVEIIQNLTPEMSAYAPPLLECNENRIVYASSRGMVIYDRTQQKVSAVIDLQKIGCNYFTTDSLFTRVIIDGSEMDVFNVEGQKAQGNCYHYVLPEQSAAVNDTENLDDTIQSLEPARISPAEDVLVQQWEQKMGGKYLSTFEYVDAETMNQWHAAYMNYSENAVLWKTSDQEAYISCLLLQENNKYQLYTKNQTDGRSTIETLQIAIPEEAAQQNQDANKLPRYTYTGDDEIMRTICNYLVEKEMDQEETQTSFIWIPAPVIFNTVKEDGEIKVFGNFWTFVYYKNGNTLECDGGGEWPACIHLKENEGTYTVVRMEEAGDGDRYVKDIRKFCKGHPFIYLKYFKYEKNQRKRDEIRRELLQQYVTDNQLDIKYYHDFGWDPVLL